MPRGRPKGSTNRPKGDTAKPQAPALKVVSSTPAPARAGPGHNSNLTEDQARALHFHHVGSYAKALDRKKSADADLRNVAKQIKADGGSVRAVKLSIQLKTPEGEEKFKAEREEDLRVAQWNNLPVGVQGQLFDVDNRSLDERAFEQGRNDGAEGKFLSVPDTYKSVTTAANAYNDGWKEGQALLGDRIKPTATLLRPTKQAAAPTKDLDDDDNDALSDGDGGAPWPDDTQVGVEAGPDTA